MKSERRHELQHNVLDQKLADVVAFLKKYANYLSLGIFLIALVILISVYVHNKGVTTQVAMQNRYEEAFSAADSKKRLDIFKELAQQNKNRRIAALANLGMGNDYLAQFIAGEGKLTDGERKDLLEKAKASYKKVVAEYSDQKVQLAQAYFGLGKLAQDQQQFKEAADSFTKAMENAPAGNPVAALATEAKTHLASLEQPVKMATTAPSTQPASAPATAPTTAPATAPAAAPTTAPAGK